MGGPYDYAWQQFRASKLKREPLCAWCADRGLTVAATTVHHIIRIRDDPSLRLSDSNTVSLCKPCHDGPAQREEKRGDRPGYTSDGHPVDRGHPWNQKRKH